MADEFVSALEHVVGPQSLLQSVCIGPDDNMERRRQDILSAIANAETGDGVIVLTDMFGGTPSNLAISLLEEANIEVIAGVNLPVLVKLASIRKSSDMASVVAEARDAGRKYIKLASNLLEDPPC